jgi:CRISPR-associated protein Csx14
MWHGSDVLKNILLAVSGLSPQVITEALYALWYQGRPVSRLEIITTRTGKERIFAGLFSPMDGRIDAFLTEFGIAPDSLEFGPHLLHVIKDEAGVEREDIVSAEDNEILLQTCLKTACRLTSDPETAVFFLVAGGRKTMTSCLTLAAQFYGRLQDRIYHVLVTPEFEQCRDFWYPPRTPRDITVRDDKGREHIMSTRYAKIDLISIPFVSVRDRLDPKLISRPISSAELLASMIRDKPPVLTIDLSEGKLSFKGIELDLYPAHLALYAFFAGQKATCTKALSCQNCTDCYLELCEILNRQEAISRRYHSTRAVDDMSDSGILALTQENFNSYKSKINSAIIQRYGQGLAADLIIGSVGHRPNIRYGLRIERSNLCMK